MDQITIRVESPTLQSLEEEAKDDEVTRSEYIRNLLRDRHEPSENIEELRTEVAQCETELENVRDEKERLSEKVDELETEIERLKNEKQVIIEQRSENTELVEYVEQERNLQEQYRKAGIITKAKWSLFGMDDE
jgi:Ribbon-helix-helix protein, copG family.